MSKNKYYDEDYLSELIGQVPTQPTRYPTSTASQQQTGYQWSLPNVHAIPFKHCRTLYPWQMRVYQQMKGNRDVWILASPGGGKTPPVECYWASEVLGINPMVDPSPIQQRNVLRNFEKLIKSPKSIPKTIIMVPTRSLATQTAADFRKSFAEVIIDSLNMFIKLDQDQYEYMNVAFINLIITSFGRHAGSNIQPAIQRREQLVSVLKRQIQSSPQGQALKERIRNENQIIRRETALLIQNWVNNVLIGVTVGGGSPDNSTRPILNSAPVVIGTYPMIGGFITPAYAKNIELVIVDEAHRVHMGPGEDSDQIAKGLFKTMKTIKSANRASNTTTVYLSGTENPKSAERMAEYMNRCFGRDFNLDEIKKGGIPEARNVANITISIDDSLSDDKQFVRQMIKRINQGDWGTLAIIFSTRRIRQHAEAILNAVGGPTERTPGGITTTRGPASERFRERYGDIEGGPQTTPYITKEDVAVISQLPGAQHIEDPLLRKCVAKGFGFLFSGNYAPEEVRKDEGKQQKIESYKEFQTRQQREAEEYRKKLRREGDPYDVGLSERDKTIVAELFKQKKIKLLMSTDAIGIGVNIGVKTIMIPKLTKTARMGGMLRFNQPIELGELAQIIHRAGRSASKYATIYTTSEGAEKVSQAVEARPEDFDPLGMTSPSFWESIGINICMRHETFHRMWTDVVGLVRKL